MLEAADHIEVARFRQWPDGVKTTWRFFMH
jgi:hypothetical protein